MAKQGATRMEDAPKPSVMDRMRGIGGAIKRSIYGDSGFVLNAPARISSTYTT